MSLRKAEPEAEAQPQTGGQPPASLTLTLALLPSPPTPSPSTHLAPLHSRQLSEYLPHDQRVGDDERVEEVDVHRHVACVEVAFGLGSRADEGCVQIRAAFRLGLRITSELVKVSGWNAGDKRTSTCGLQDLGCVQIWLRSDVDAFKSVLRLDQCCVCGGRKRSGCQRVGPGLNQQPGAGRRREDLSAVLLLEIFVCG